MIAWVDLFYGKSNFANLAFIWKNVTMMEIKTMQRSGTEAIRTQLQPSKPKREITNTVLKIVKIQREHMVNRVSSYFPKGGRSATETELNII